MESNRVTKLTLPNHSCHKDPTLFGAFPWSLSI